MPDSATPPTDIRPALETPPEAFTSHVAGLKRLRLMPWCILGVIIVIMSIVLLQSDIPGLAAASLAVLLVLPAWLGLRVDGMLAKLIVKSSKASRLFIDGTPIRCQVKAAGHADLLGQYAILTPAGHEGSAAPMVVRLRSAKQQALAGTSFLEDGQRLDLYQDATNGLFAFLHKDLPGWGEPVDAATMDSGAGLMVRCFRVASLAVLMLCLFAAFALWRTAPVDSFGPVLPPGWVQTQATADNVTQLDDPRFQDKFTVGIRYSYTVNGSMLEGRSAVSADAARRLLESIRAGDTVQIAYNPYTPEISVYLAEATLPGGDGISTETILRGSLAFALCLLLLPWGWLALETRRMILAKGPFMEKLPAQSVS